MENNKLKSQINTLNDIIYDLQTDIKVLHKKYKVQNAKIEKHVEHSLSAQEKENLIQQLEHLHLKCKNLESDFCALLDEKEELIHERDTYRSKVHRLNHELYIALQGDNKKFCDVDSLIMENKYLQKKLDHMQAEKLLTDQALSKYKNVLEANKNKGSIKLGFNNLSGKVVSYKQVQQLLELGSSSWLPNSTATLSDLKCVSSALLDALQDKCVALTHQKKTNKLLANRITELEDRLKQHTSLSGKEISGSIISPSQILLNDYFETETANPNISDDSAAVSEKRRSQNTAENKNDHYPDIDENLPPYLRDMFMEALKTTESKCLNENK